MSRAVAVSNALRRLLESGDVASAGASAKAAVAEFPQQPSVLEPGVVALRRAGMIREALPAAQRWLALRPADPRARREAGLCLALAGRAAEALSASRSLPPDERTPEVEVAGARCQISLGRPDLAAAGLRARAGASADIDAALGVALLNAGDGEGALDALARAAPKSGAQVWCDLARAQRMLGRTDEAIESYRTAIAKDAALSDAAAGLAEALATLGRRDEAFAALAAHLDSPAPGVELAVAFARLARSTDRQPAAEAALERALADMRIDPARRSMLLFSMGELRESRGDFDGAFAAFREANECSPRIFSPGHAHALAGALGAHFGRSPAPEFPRSREASELPVFILGMPRSGTSLVEQILSAHPAVHGAGELEWIPRLAASLPETLGVPAPYPACLEGASEEGLTHAASRHVSRLAALAPGARRVTDKLPHNFLHVGLIWTLFPGARIIHCVRDARDTCLSCYTTQFSPLHAWSNSFAGLADAYGTYRRLMALWRGSLPGLRMLDVEYERLVAEPEARTRDIVDFVGLAWDGACLRYHEKSRAVHTASRDQAVRPIYDSSIGRWRRYGAHLAPLVESLRGWTGDEAG